MTNTTDNGPLLEVRNLSVDFRIDRKTILHAVREVSFTVGSGETLGILGESGCGKSVTCMSILQLNPARTTIYPAGEILFEGKDLLRISPKEMQHIRGNRVSMIFQEPMTAMNPLYTIGTQLMEAVRLHRPGIAKAEARELVLEAIASVRIPNPDRIFDTYPFALSGGMLQRCMIAMAMLARPKLLICDEPTTALDVTIQAQVLELMNELKEKEKTSIIFVTHDLGVINEMADRVMVMYGGRKCEEGETAEVFLHPAHPYTKGLIASHPSPDYTGRRLPTIPGGVPSLKDMPKGCPFNNRCSLATEKCAGTFPEYREISEDHLAGCFALEQQGENHGRV